MHFPGMMYCFKQSLMKRKLLIKKLTGVRNM